MEALFPSLDETLRIIVGDMNSPFKPIRYNSDMTSLCPPNLNELWSEPCSPDIAIVRALDGAFACQTHQLKECITSSIDVTCGKVFQAHQKKVLTLNYFPKEKMYLQETIEEVFKKRASLRR